MTTQPEALRLAAIPIFERSITWQSQAAIELRRQHGEIKSMRTERLRSERRLLDVKDQRDALLEALKYLDKEFRQHGRQHWPEAVRVRATIKAMEGETK